MAFGPEFISGLVHEFKKILPLRISKVEGGNFWVALKFHNDKNLLLSWNTGASGLCIANSNEVEILKNLSSSRNSLIEALKSRLLRGGEIFDAEQINDDRIIKLFVRRRVSAGLSVNYFLILEITEPIGNFILLDSNYKIEEAAKHSAPDQNSYRTILPGHLYNTPPKFNGINLNIDSNLKFEDVQNLNGIGRPLTRLIQAHWDEKNILFWKNAILNLRDPDKNNNIKCQIITKNNYLTRFEFDFPECHILNLNPLDASRYAVLDKLLSKAREKKLNEINTKLKRAVKSRERHLDGLIKQLKECERAEIFKLKGETILSNLNNIPAYSSKINLTTWDGVNLEIELDPNLNASKNAEKYFKKYRKFKNDPEQIKINIDSVKSAIKEISEQYDILESLNSPEEFEQAYNDVLEWLEPENKNKNNAKNKKLADKNPPHLIFTVGENENIIILAGLSARGNRYVLKQARQNDIWLHAHELPGSHVIIKNISRNELENEKLNILEFAASIAAQHSKGKNSNSVQIDYTERKHVRPVPGTIALVTYTNPGTIRISPKKGL